MCLRHIYIYIYQKWGLCLGAKQAKSLPPNHSGLMNTDMAPARSGTKIPSPLMYNLHTIWKVYKGPRGGSSCYIYIRVVCVLRKSTPLKLFLYGRNRKCMGCRRSRIGRAIYIYYGRALLFIYLFGVPKTPIFLYGVLPWWAWEVGLSLQLAQCSRGTNKVMGFCVLN